MWPQIGEYTENGVTVKVFKPAYADQRLSMEGIVKISFADPSKEPAHEKYWEARRKLRKMN